MECTGTLWSTALVHHLQEIIVSVAFAVKRNRSEERYGSVSSCLSLKPAVCFQCSRRSLGVSADCNAFSHHFIQRLLFGTQNKVSCHEKVTAASCFFLLQSEEEIKMNVLLFAWLD